MAFPFLEDLVRYLTGWDLPLPVPMFGLWVALAFLASGWAFKKDIEWWQKVGRVGKHIDAAEFANNIIVMSAFSGIIGARLFHILEHPAQFMDDPWGMLFSRGGYTVLGGLILGVAVGVRYATKLGYPVKALLDAAAPAMILGYAVGRIGCQLSGDGDWGIPADMALKPDWIPTWLWASTYEGNVLGEKIAAPGVYPTPIYESVAAFGIFFGLRWMRLLKRGTGWIFAAYLFWSGLERYWIESIRINVKYDFGFIQPTQAEMLSAGLMLLGIGGMIWRWRIREGDETDNSPSARGEVKGSDSSASDNSSKKPGKKKKRRKK